MAEILPYLFNVLSEDDQFIGQAFQATSTSGKSKILITRHQVVKSRSPKYKFVPYLGKTHTIASGDIYFWNYGDIELDVAEIPLKNNSGGIVVSKLQDTDTEVIIPSSRKYPEAAAIMLRLSIIRLATTYPDNPFLLMFKSWNEDNSVDFGNSGAPIFNSAKEVVGITTHKLSAPDLVYGGYGQLVEWKFNNN